MTDRNGNNHLPGGRPDGGRYAPKNGVGADDDLTAWPVSRGRTRTHADDVRSADFLAALERMPADQAKEWARKAGVVMDGRDLPYREGRYAVWAGRGVAFVDVMGGRAVEAPFDPSAIDPPADWRDA